MLSPLMLCWRIHVSGIVTEIIVRAPVELSSVPCSFKGLPRCCSNSFGWQQLIGKYIIYFMESDCSVLCRCEGVVRASSCTDSINENVK